MPVRTAPPAIWTAFAAQGRWKNFVMVGQLVLLALLTQVTLKLARTEPAVVVVDERGEGHFVERGVASEALLTFLAEQRGAPTDLTLVAFTRRFLNAALAPNSTTLEEQWAESLSMMAAPLAAKMDAEARAQKLFETYRLAQVKTRLEVISLDVLERHGDKIHLRARVLRRRESLASPSSASSLDAEQVDLVLAMVPRTRSRPDGVMVVEWRTTPVASESPPSQP